MTYEPPVAPAPTLRRANRAELTATELPEAAPLARARTAGKPARGIFLLAGGLTAAGIIAIAIGLFGSGGVPGAPLDPASASAPRPSDATAPMSSLSESLAADLTGTQDDAASEDVSNAEEQPTEPQDPHPLASASPADPASPPGPVPSIPTPDTPTAPAVPTAPSVTQPPTAPAPSVPAAPRPLAFAGISENYVLGDILGIKLLSSYTLSVTGQPGTTATVAYGSTNAGTVTFDGNGYASLTLGKSLLNLGLGNPIIRVAYSDGTAGSAIEAYRDSL